MEVNVSVGVTGVGVNVNVNVSVGGGVSVFVAVIGEMTVTPGALVPVKGVGDRIIDVAVMIPGVREGMGVQTGNG
jgi:hypothetical protein